MSFIPDTATLLSYSLACLLLFITPGPDMTLFLQKTLEGGRAAGIAAMSGAVSGTFIHTIAATFGLSALIAASPTAFNALKIIGALYLLWLAYQAVRYGSAFSVETKEKIGSLKRIYMIGIGINLTNPKVILFFITFLPQFVSASDPNASGKFFFLGSLLVLICVPLALLMIVTAEKFIETMRSSPRILRLIDLTFASVFASFAVKIFFTT